MYVNVSYEAFSKCSLMSVECNKMITSFYILFLDIQDETVPDLSKKSSLIKQSSIAIVIQNWWMG